MAAVALWKLSLLTCGVSFSGERLPWSARSLNIPLSVCLYGVHVQQLPDLVDGVGTSELALDLQLSSLSCPALPWGYGGSEQGQAARKNAKPPPGSTGSHRYRAKHGRTSWRRIPRPRSLRRFRNFSAPGAFFFPNLRLSAVGQAPTARENALPCMATVARSLCARAGSASARRLSERLSFIHSLSRVPSSPPLASSPSSLFI